MSDLESLDGNLFEEPEGYVKPPAPHRFAEYERKNKTPSKVNLRLVGSSPLWAHYLWNAGVFTADYIDKHGDELVKGKDVLELGAASALPSIISGYNKARTVVSTDYPDTDLIENIQYNVDHAEDLDTSRVFVEGYIWGNDYEPLLSKIRDEEHPNKKFDFIVLSDLVFNHSEHHKLLKTCQDNLEKDGKCLVVFSPHRPKLLDADLQFFETSKEYGFKPEKIDLISVKPMFEEDEETIDIRARVYSFFLEFNQDK